MIAGRLSGGAAVVLCERIARLFDDGRASSVVCDLSALDRADLAAVDGLARLQLAARRRGRRMRLRGTSRELRQLIALLGLGDVLPSERRRVSGSPNSGNSLAVSRKAVKPTTRPFEISSTWSDHGSWLPPGPLGRYWPNAGRPLATVGIRRDPRQPAPGPEPPGQDVVAAAQPHLVWRHRLHRVLVQQGGQQLDVVGLERLDVARQQRLLLLDPSAAIGSLGSRSRSAIAVRALCRALLTETTLVSSSSATSAAFQRSTSRRISTARWRARQVLERGDERQPDRLARLGQLGRVAVHRQHAAVGHRLEPGRLQHRRRERRIDRGARGRRSIGRARRFRPSSMSRQTLVAMR